MSFIMGKILGDQSGSNCQYIDLVSGTGLIRRIQLCTHTNDQEDNTRVFELTEFTIIIKRLNLSFQIRGIY